MNTNIYGDFQICISVPLIKNLIFYVYFHSCKVKRIWLDQYYLAGNSWNWLCFVIIYRETNSREFTWSFSVFCVWHCLFKTCMIHAGWKGVYEQHTSWNFLRCFFAKVDEFNQYIQNMAPFQAVRRRQFYITWKQILQ